MQSWVHPLRHSKYETGTLHWPVLEGIFTQTFIPDIAFQTEIILPVLLASLPKSPFAFAPALHSLFMLIANELPLWILDKWDIS